MAKACVACVFLKLLLILLWESTLADPVNDYARLSNKIDSINAKLETMDEKLEILLRGDRDKSDGETTVESKATVKNCVDLISIERTPAHGGNRFTLRFRKNSDDEIKSTLSYTGYDLETTQPEDLGDGVWSLSYDVPFSQGNPWLMIGDNNFHHIFWMTLENENASSALQEFEEIPTVQLSIPNEVAYSPGEDIYIEASASACEIKKAFPSLEVNFSGIDLDTGKYKEVFDRQDLFTSNYTRPKYTENKVEASATLLTSTHHLSGYLQFTLGKYDTGDSVVSTLLSSRQIKVHPVSQSGVFPPGYLAIAEMMLSQELSDNGNALITCTEDECPVYCMAAGANITGIEVFEMKNDGTMAGVPSAERSPTFYENFATVVWMVNTTIYPGDENGITTFKCRAHDSNGQTVVEMYDVKYVIPQTLIEDESWISYDTNNGIVENVTLHCTMTGQPETPVLFTFPNFIQQAAPDAVVALTEDPNKFVAIRKIRIELQNQAVEETFTNNLRYAIDEPSCELFTPEGYQRIVLEFPSGFK